MADFLTQNALSLMVDFFTGQEVETMELELGLFINNVGFGCFTDLTTLVECTAPGYARIPLVGADWVQSTGDCFITAAYPTVQFAITGNGGVDMTVFGHFVRDAISGFVLWGDNWLNPWSIPAEVVSNPELSPTWLGQNCASTSGARGIRFNRRGVSGADVLKTSKQGIVRSSGLPPTST